MKRIRPSDVEGGVRKCQNKKHTHKNTSLMNSILNHFSINKKNHNKKKEKEKT